jgi:hypothetical protein
MLSILIGNESLDEVPFENEEELALATIKRKRYILGDSCVYFDYKRRMGERHSRNKGIPDGFLIDFSNPSEPQLFFVEYELESHQLYDHIGPQVMRFYASFESALAQRELQLKLTGIIRDDRQIRLELEQKTKGTAFQNVDALLNYVIYDRNVGIIIVIDEQTEDLISLLRRFAERPEVIVVKRFQKNEKVVYHYDPFRAVEVARPTRVRAGRRGEGVDTIVCPAREDGFAQAFLEKNAWWAVRVSPSLIPQLKWIAMYETRPVKAVRWIGKIQEGGIKPYKNTGKYIIYVAKKSKLDRPISLDSNKKGVAPQSPRYTNYADLKKAKHLRDLW